MFDDDDGYYYGDPRRCPRHPRRYTSSRDGLHDAPCGACEYEMEVAAERDAAAAAGEPFEPPPARRPPVDLDPDLPF